MSNRELKLNHPPIIEAILDINCDLPSGIEFAAMEISSKNSFLQLYPIFKTQFLDEYQIQRQSDSDPEFTSIRGVQAFQFLSEDEKQILQVRQQGFSFNRLAPYSSLVDYLSEIECAWKSYVELASPVLIRSVNIRYINRILLPRTEGKLDIEEYFKIGPRLPDQKQLILTGFLNQYSATDIDTGNLVNLVQTIQPPEMEYLPIILDITVSNIEVGEPSDWNAILKKISVLRTLKNLVFEKALTEKCLTLFQ